MGNALPNWPALMDADMAAAYCSVCPVTFQSLASRYGVAPVDMGARVTRWRKRDLDGLVDRLPARGDTKDNAPVIDMAQAALDKARKRAR